MNLSHAPSVGTFHETSQQKELHRIKFALLSTRHRKRGSEFDW